MRFGLLGPLTVYDDETGEHRPVRSAKGRALLAALLTRPNRVVPVSELKAALWDDEPPPSAHASLHNHVTRLRRLLAEEDRLRAVPPGYLLRVGPGELDTDVFEQRVRAARAAHAQGDWAETVARARGALELWRGTPQDAAPALVQRLREARLLVLEWRYDAELHLGGHEGGALVPELAALVAEFPLREAFHRQLMLVLHRSGRQPEALAVFQSLRRTLVEELGVDPGPAVQEAYQEVLRDPAPAVASAPPSEPERRSPTPGPRTPHPAQLPPPPAHFTGRSDVVTALCAALTGAAPGPHVVVLSGMAGVGKSALALHVSHRLRGEFPGGQLYFNLHGATPCMAPLTVSQVLCALLRDLGVDPCRVPEEADAAAALLRSTLAPTRTLLVFDDAASAAQVRPLLPAGAGCAVIVTSRSSLAALDGAVRFPLAPLSARDSTDLLRSVSGRGELLDAGDAERLVERCGRLPLALRVVAARLAARRALAPGVLAGLLDAEAGRLDHLEYDDLSVRSSLSVAHDALNGSDRRPDLDAALALRRLGALDLPEYGAPLVARLMDTGVPRAAAALDRLVDVALLDEVSYGRFAPHDLVRDFARELAARHHTAPDLDAAVERGLRWYAESARQAGLALLPPGREGEIRVPPPIDPVTATPFDSEAAAFAWGDRELPQLVALAERYAFTSATARLLIRACFPYLQRRGRLQELIALNRLGLGAARHAGDTEAEAHALTDLAGVHFMSGRREEAMVLNDEATALWRRLGADHRIQRGLANRGMLCERLGRHAEAAEALEQSLGYARRLSDDHGEAIILSHLGNLHEHTDARAAIGYHELSLAAGLRLGSALLQYSAHCNIGFAHLTLGEQDAALPHFDEGLRLMGDDGDWQTQSQTRLGRVRALRALARTGYAEQECTLLLDRAQERGDTYTEGLARHEYGHLLRAAEREAEAFAQWRLALAALDGTDTSVRGELDALLADSG
ncbi:AfsR/SARP family transcriptional regulator [Streptomyces spiramyceticus]|uniref:AfsR/SARP family transcriptional regulator n=1 Tax=Streptomyces spiramyceticus TaxID=299717 RepID=UPI00237B5EF6|nr:AfsR/SARP family transcriptional regulator [Streptomyces spiramyceticus]